jgi:hypothetical protein
MNGGECAHRMGSSTWHGTWSNALPPFLLSHMAFSWLLTIPCSRRHLIIRERVVFSSAIMSHSDKRSMTATRAHTA